MDSSSTTKSSRTAASFSRQKPYASTLSCNDFTDYKRESRQKRFLQEDGSWRLRHAESRGRTMNERDHIERGDESHAAAEPSPKPVIDQPAELPAPGLQIEGTKLPTEPSAKSSNDAPESAVISARQSADGLTGAQVGARDESRKDATIGIIVTVERKHSLVIRWMHWINFPLLTVMIYSGLLVYWSDSQHEGLTAHRVYRVGFGSWTLFRLFPPWFYNNLHLKFQLAKGLGYHFFFMWFFALNGMAYVLYTFFSGEWRELRPTRHSFLDAIKCTFQHLGSRSGH